MDAHQISGVPMASTSWALEAAQVPCVPPAGHCQENATGLLITSQVQGCDWYGWCVVRPRWNWRICFWYSTNDASAEITGMWIPFCPAHCRSYPLLLRNQPDQAIRYTAMGTTPNQAGSQR